MKKIIGALFILLLLSLCACSASVPVSSSLKSGTYIIETQADSIPSSYIILDADNNSFVFVHSILSGYVPTGNYEIKNDKLLLSTVSTERYIFDINDGNLTYNQTDSTKPPGFSVGEIYDGAVFVYSEQ